MPGGGESFTAVGGVLEQSRVGRSWRLLVGSWSFVLGDRALRRFSLAAGAVWLLAAAAFFAVLGRLLAATGQGLEVVALSLVAYYPFTLLGVSIGVALVAGAAEVVGGGEPTVGGMVAAVRGRFRQIAAWSALVAGVGVLLDQVVQRLPWGGRLARTVLGAAWALATLFAVPILATEGCDVRECLRRSAHTFKRRWGEGTVGSLSIFAAVVVVSVPACVIMGAGAGALVSGAGGSWPYVALITGGVAMTAAGYGALVMRDLFAFALYRYVDGGAVVGGFREEDLCAGVRVRGAHRVAASLDACTEAGLRRGRSWILAGLGVYTGSLVIGAVIDPQVDWLVDAPVVVGTLVVAHGAFKAARVALRAGARRKTYIGLAVAAALQLLAILVYLIQTARDAEHGLPVAVWLIGVAALVPALAWAAAQARRARGRDDRVCERPARRA